MIGMADEIPWQMHRTTNHHTSVHERGQAEEKQLI
jgi:hypothetical protein